MSAVLAPTVCERCADEPVAHVVALDGLEGADYGDSVQFWGDDCVEGVVHGMDAPDLAARYLGHRPMRVPVSRHNGDEAMSRRLSSFELGFVGGNVRRRNRAGRDCRGAAPLVDRMRLHRYRPARRLHLAARVDHRPEVSGPHGMTPRTALTDHLYRKATSDMDSMTEPAPHEAVTFPSRQMRSDYRFNFREALFADALRWQSAGETPDDMRRIWWTGRPLESRQSIRAAAWRETARDFAASAADSFAVGDTWAHAYYLAGYAAAIARCYYWSAKQ